MIKYLLVLVCFVGISNSTDANLGNYIKTIKSSFLFSKSLNFQRFSYESSPFGCCLPINTPKKKLSWDIKKMDKFITHHINKMNLVFYKQFHTSEPSIQQLKSNESVTYFEAYTPLKNQQDILKAPQLSHTSQTKNNYLNNSALFNLSANSKIIEHLKLEDVNLIDSPELSRFSNLENSTNQELEDIKFLYENIVITPYKKITISIQEIESKIKSLDKIDLYFGASENTYCGEELSSDISKKNNKKYCVIESSAIMNTQCLELSCLTDDI